MNFHFQQQRQTTNADFIDIFPKQFRSMEAYGRPA